MVPATVSVVIPVKDDAEMLARCLDALAGQSLAAFEIIVVDDGSTDPSAEVARSRGALVVPSAGSGIPAASATGYDAATGQLLARLDADCVPDPDWLERIEHRFASEPDLEAMTGGARFHDGPRALRRVGPALYLGAYLLFTAPALGHAPLFGSNLALRRTTWLAVRDRVHRDDELVHDDLDLAFHVGPVRRILIDRDLGMTMSSRPFFEGRAMFTRLRRGVHSVVVHWPHDLPPRRWIRRLRGERSTLEA